MQPPSPFPAAEKEAPLGLPWPCTGEGRKLLVLGLAPGGRSQSLGRFLGAAFTGFGLLLLLVGTQQSLPPALAGGGACIFAGLALLAVVRTGRAPLLILDGERGEAALCRRRLGSRAFRLFPLDSLGITASPDGREVRIRPGDDGPAGREIPGLPSRISDKEWRQGMTLPTPDGNAGAAAAELERWRHLARLGEPPEIADACDAAEFTALLGKALPAALLLGLDGESADLPPGGKEEDEAGGKEEDEAGAPQRPFPRPVTPHPEIRRAPDLRSTTGNRDKRD